jgi:hypothetical protein
MVAQQSPKLKERVRFLPPVPILVWPSLVRRLVWDQKIAGSNPATKTNCGCVRNGYGPDCKSVLWEFESPHPLQNMRL